MSSVTRMSSELRCVVYQWHVWLRTCLSHIFMIFVSCHAYNCHVTRMTETYERYECVVPHIWALSLITNIYESCHTYVHWTRKKEKRKERKKGRKQLNRVASFDSDTHEWGTSHIWMSRITRVGALSHVTYMNIKLPVVHMSHITQITQSCHTFEWIVSHICMSHVTLERRANVWILSRM